ncbi:hypothetical protein WICPIJ_007227 [Wickerhamomyces pijperi]|uniref:Uncharacterized protein n=1 Tax=Wickerhamomyces pijperi TaxID=599730 RepID=A0A9P8Q0K9_WICPI|nr:hypothetical protein WICPIJ_007227 [Wickerhamomyces pijperi]
MVDEHDLAWLVENHILTSVSVWKNTSGLGCRDFEIWDDGNTVDILTPVILDVTTNVMWWDRWDQPGVTTTSWFR